MNGWKTFAHEAIPVKLLKQLMASPWKNSRGHIRIDVQRKSLLNY